MLTLLLPKCRYGVDFPDDANIKMKSVLLAACFLVDYLYFEGDGGLGAGGDDGE